MTLTTAAIGMLALAAQIGVPLQDGATSGRGLSGPGVAPVAVPAGPSGAGSPAAGSAWTAAELETVTHARAALEGVPYAGGLSALDLLWVETTLRSMTLREKVAQLVVPYIEGGRPEEGSARWRRAKRLVTQERVGGFIVGVGASYSTASFLNELQGWSSVPLLMTADLEWGPGTRLRGATVLPINMAIGAAGPASLAYEAGRITGLEARAAGLHVAYAPVADVNVNPANPVINTRAYGSDASLVSDRVVEFIRGARSAGLMTVAKHFPGHGDTDVDSHLALPVLGVDRLRLDAVELAPFRAAIGAGVDGVMTAHMAVPALDPRGRNRPATLSPPILTALLRQDLGFGGLVVTDALHMDGVKGHGRAGEVAVAAVLAGADILLIPPDEIEAIDAVVRAVRQRRISESRIDHSVRRVLAAKAAVGLNHEPRVYLGQVLTQLGRDEHAAWSREVAERSLTLVRGEAGRLPARLRDRSVLLVAYDDRAGHGWGAALAESLEERGARVTVERLSRRSNAAALERARSLAAESELVLVASFTRAIPWRGGLGWPEEVASLANELVAAGAPLLSFGDPYMLRQIPDARTYLIAWSETDTSQRAVARALAGEIPVTGRLPIDLPPQYGIGHGLVVPSVWGVVTRRP